MNHRPIANSGLGKIVLILMMLLSVDSVAIAATLEAYRSKVDAARIAGASLEDSLRNNEIDASARSNFVGQIRRDFPASERVEWQGGSVETSNDWLLDKAKALENESDSKKQLTIVLEMREYLSAISFKIEEMKAAAEASRTKDEDKQKLAEILRREEYQKPQAKEESVFQRWLRSFLEWLESIFPRPSAPQGGFSGAGLLAFVLQILLYVGLVALLVFLVYKIAPLLFPKLKRTAKPKKKRRVILGEQLAEDATARDLLSEAERLAREGNLRGAIRKGYIALLCELSDRKVIGLARNKTNRDYLRDVRSRRELHPRMKTITDTFERHWYGFQESAEPDWTRFREEYNEAIRSL